MKMQTNKKGGFLWVALVAVLLVVLVIIGAMAIGRQMSGDTEETGTQNSQMSEEPEETGAPSETDTESEMASETETESETEIIAPDKGDGSELFAIFGVDSRSDALGKGTRSDSIMIVSVNHDAGEVKVVSIYRDCMLYLEHNGTVKGYKKINSAHSYFGPEGAVAALNMNLDLHIENYVTVNFGALQELVDLIGGVDIELSDAEIGEINSMSGSTLSGAGVHKLNGAQALAFSRIRKLAGSDYKRTERQREVLFEIFETSKELGMSKRLQLVETMMDEIATNYSEDEMLALLYYISEYEIVEMTAYPQVFYSGTIDGSWVEVPCTLVDMNKSLHKILLGETEYTPSELVESISATLRGKFGEPNKDMRD